MSEPTFTPYFILRLTGLPSSRLKELRFCRTTSLLEEYDRHTATLDTNSQDLCGHIFEVIPKVEPHLGALLLNAKRAVFNRRSIHKFIEICAGLKGIDEQLADHLTKHQETCKRVHHLLDSAADMFQRELEEKRKILKRHFADEDFRKGLLLSSPTLFRAAEDYVRAETLRKKQHKTEHKLLLYYFRCLTKTSPFSTFTTVTEGRFGPKEPFSPVDMTKQAVVTMNVTLVETLIRRFYDHKEVRPSLPLALNRTLEIRGDRYHYIRVMDQFLAQKGNLKIGELFTVTQNQIMRVVADVLGDRKTVTFDQLQQVLTDEAGGDEKATAIIDRLIELDFLVIVDPFVHLAGWPLERLRRHVTSVTFSGQDSLLEQIETLDEAVTAYPHASLQQRVRLLQSVNSTIKHCFEALGAEPESWNPPLYEDTRITKTPVYLPETFLQGTQRDLGDVAKLATLFSENVIENLHMTGFYRHYFPNRDEVPFLDFYESYFKEFFLQHKQTKKSAGLTNPNYFDMPEIERINALRTCLAEHIQSQDSDNVVHLDRALVTQLIADIPQPLRGPISKAFYLQLDDPQNGGPIVVNHIYPGRGHAFTRFTRLFENGTDLQRHFKTAFQQLEQKTGVHYAELTTHFSSNLNLHQSLIDAELLLPCEQGNANQELAHSLEMSHTTVRIQNGMLRLYSKALEAPIMPIYMGYLTPLLMSDMYRILYFFSENDFSSMNEILWSRKIVRNRQAITHPRIQYGRLALRRKHRLVRLDNAPRQRKGETPFDFYIRTRNWFRAMALPFQGYAKFHQKTALLPTKPAYIDLENVFSFRSFMRQMQAEENHMLQMDEVLPNTSFIQAGRETYPSELVLECNLEAW